VGRARAAGMAYPMGRRRAFPRAIPVRVRLGSRRALRNAPRLATRVQRNGWSTIDAAAPKVNQVVAVESWVGD
jgi:hypothetical protein